MQTKSNQDEGEFRCLQTGRSIRKRCYLDLSCTIPLKGACLETPAVIVIIKKGSACSVGYVPASLEGNPNLFQIGKGFSTG